MLGYRKTAASNAQLLLAVPCRATLPILELLGLRRILRIYPTPAAALAAVAEAAASTTGRVSPPIEQQAGVARLEHQARGPAARGRATHYESVPVRCSPVQSARKLHVRRWLLVAIVGC
jgi:hypothetical protein